MTQELTMSEKKTITKHKLNVRWFTWYALFITLLAVSSTDIYISSLPQMTIDFNASPNLVNLTISIYTLTMAVAVLFAGILSNRFGRRKIILLGIGAFTIASFLISASNSIYLVILFRVVQAFGCGCLAIVTRLVLKDTMNAKEQVHATGVLVMGIVLSPAIAPSVGAILAQHWGWKSCFDLSGVGGIILSIAGYFIVQETNATPIKRLNSIASYVADYFKLLNDKTCVYFTILNSFTFAIYFVFIGISSYLFINTYKMSPLVYSYLFIIIALGYFAGNSLMMVLNRHHFSQIRIINLGIYFSIAGLVILLASFLFVQYRSAVIIFITLGVIIMRAASALIIAPAQVKILEHFKERGALALGLSTAAQFACASIAVSLVAIYHNLPLYSLIVVTIIFFVPTVLIVPKLRLLFKN
jgi:DHA1 family bicyclomycin/chloramphenicol resistance-like MFS transporter